MALVFHRSEEVGRWVCGRLGGAWNVGENAIGFERRGELIAGVVYDNFLGGSICMHVAAQGTHWLTRDFLRAVFAYPFDQLRVRKVIGPVDSTNAQARRFDEHLGFIPEAVLSGASKHGDLILYSMTRQQCRFLKD